MIILSLVAPFVSEPRHQNLHFSSCSLWLCTHGPNLFPEDICYSIVDDDASNARWLHGFLHNYSAGRFATSLSILFGNCVEKIAEIVKHDWYQTYSRLTSNKCRTSGNERKKKSNRFIYLWDYLLFHTACKRG